MLLKIAIVYKDGFWNNAQWRLLQMVGLTSSIDWKVLLDQFIWKVNLSVYEPIYPLLPYRKRMEKITFYVQDIINTAERASGRK